MSEPQRKSQKTEKPLYTITLEVETRHLTTIMIELEKIGKIIYLKTEKANK